MAGTESQLQHLLVQPPGSDQQTRLHTLKNNVAELSEPNLGL